MNITFLIGNGFDLRLGMKTKYTDMYNDYINTDNADKIIKEFQKTLKTDAPKYETWADFEMGMAQYAQNFENEDDFIKCIRDFKFFMINYLTEEQNKFFDFYNRNFLVEMDVLDEFEQSITNFYDKQIPNVKKSLDNIANFTNKNKIINFITFNYTGILEFIRDRFNLFAEIGSNHLLIDEIVHIHGDLNSNVVLGVDNADQIKNVKFNINRKVERAFIKPRFNHYYDIARIELANDVLKNSDVICIYGLSLGESDLTWSKKIVNWLLSSTLNQLFYFTYGTNKFENWNIDAKMDEEDVLKMKLLERFGVSTLNAEKIYEQIHIPVGEDIFNIYSILKSIDNQELLNTIEDNLVTV